MKNYLETKFKNKKVLILGFAREGQSTYKILRTNLPDMEIGVADQNLVDYQFEGSVTTFFGSTYLDHLTDFDVVIKSPGVSGLNPKVVVAQKQGVEITSQTKIFFDICQGVVIGVTGTKGKSTTSSLIYEIMKSAGKNVALVGNIGSPVLDSLENDSPDKYYVFELSSHQLFDLEKSPHIAVVTNVAVDHLDWYGNFENYVDAKTNIVKYQNQVDIAILNYDNLVTRGFDRFGEGHKYFTSRDLDTSNAYVANNSMYINTGGNIEKLGDVTELKLIGKHNWDNVMAAALVAKIIGIDNETIWKTSINFKQLEHHLEFVREYNEASFYNDSFAVDQIATIAAVNSFNQETTLILGGFDRGIDYTELAETVAQKQNVKTVVVIGQVKEKIIKFLKDANYKGKVVKLEKVKMDKIVNTALKNTPKGGIVLFSPAAASFDMFKDYKDRGEQFKQSVNDLK